MMKKVLFGILTFAVIGCMGCGERQEKEVNPEPVQEKTEASYKEGETVTINEEILENLYIEADIEIPSSTKKVYETTLKKFDEDEMIQMFFSEDGSEDVIREYDETGGVSAEYGAQSLILVDGSLRYFRDDEIQSIRNLISCAEAYQILESGELGFQSIEEADALVRSYLDKMNIAGEAVRKTVYSADAQKLQGIQNYCLENDETFRAMTENGKFQIKDSFEENNEVYYLEYQFQLDGTPVFNSDDPDIAVSGGIEAPPIAQVMKVTAYVSASGIRYMEISNVVEREMELAEEGELITVDEVKQSLSRKYGDVILTNKMTVSRIYLEYIPQIDIVDYTKIKMTPVWCCEIQEEGSDFIQGDRYHAITGEEIS